MKYGYRTSERGETEEHPGEQKVIQAIHEYRAAGLPEREIQAKLEAHGFAVETIGERTSAAMQHKAPIGEYTGGEPPYGYQVSSDGVRLEEHPGEQEVILGVHACRAEGLSIRQIAAKLEAHGFAVESTKKPRNAALGALKSAL